MRLTLLAVLLFAVPALAQSISIDMNPFGGRVAVTPPPDSAPTTITTRTEESSGDGFHIAYRESDSGSTQLEILEPRGAWATLWDGNALVAEDDIPTSARVRSGKWFRLVVTRPDGAVFERKLQSKAGMIGAVRVFGFSAPAPVVSAPPPQQQPVALSSADFNRLRSAIQAEGFGDQKLDVLRTAARDAWFTCDQVGALIELFTFGNEKVEVVSTVRDHLVDPQNGFTLYERFTFANEKEEVKRLLSAR